jgi:hypothetical protein
MRLGIAMLLMLGVAGAAMAQGYPVPGPFNALPYYNAGTATSSTTGRPPLSPYLNLLNGNNPALNYYYGVRPLLPGGSSGMPQQQPQPMLNRGGFFQPSVQSKLLTVDEDEPIDTKKTVLTSPGGPVSYGNFNGSSRAGVQQGGSFFNRGQQGAGPVRR